ncbi:adhesion G-protein coupled receptor G2 [Trichomycterus rosablanca]|uniref:adhesion G-protein coupled receptor G2 n=1 Tax=Trichomycterus rosablanca TaxID=2290929 RepID=UPI002F35695E
MSTTEATTSSTSMSTTETTTSTTSVSTTGPTTSTNSMSTTGLTTRHNFYEYHRTYYFHNFYEYYRTYYFHNFYEYHQTYYFHNFYEYHRTNYFHNFYEYHWTYYFYNFFDDWNQTLIDATLNSSQVEQLVSQIEDALSRPSISVETGQRVVTTIDKLLNSSSEAVSSSSNRLIKAVDDLGLKLFVKDKQEMISAGSVALLVTKIDGKNFAGSTFMVKTPSFIEMKDISERSVNTSLATITLPASLTSGLSAEERNWASRIQITYFNKNTLFQKKNNTNQTLNSHVVGASVANLSITGLKEAVYITFKNLNGTTQNLTCVFWDFNRNGGAGGWNSSGCSLLNSTKDVIECSCNHLTSFAVLMDISREGITDPVHELILTFITYIGCGISSIFIAFTLLTYLAFEKLRKDIPSKILIHLCFALLLLNLVFLVDSWLALYPNAVGLCISTAFFLHYFLLTSFTWMALEALNLYLSIVKVFRRLSRYMLKLSLVGWGVPLIVVIIVISINKDFYGLGTYGKFTNTSSDDFCWINNAIVFYVAVVAYFCFMFAASMIVFIVVMVQLRRIKRQNPHNNHYRSIIQDLRSAAGLAILLGLTWGFAFFAWGPVHLPFMYLFTIFNSLQGFFIFVFHCAMKESVRIQWRIYLCCGKLRLAENSDSPIEDNVFS